MENKSRQKQRVQFDFPPEAIDRIDRLKTEINAPTRAEVVRNALRLYEWFATHVDPDFVVEIKDQEGKVVYRITAEMLLS